MTVQASKLNDGFEEVIAGYQGCETVARCFACGSCSGVCPVEKVVDDFDPRKIVHMVGMGFEEQLIESDIIWACSQCQSCIPVCPQEVRCADVVKALRQEAEKRRVVGVSTREALGLVAVVDAGKCVACLTCVRMCPVGAASVMPEGFAEIDPDKCRGCSICVLDCPAEAIELAPSMEERGAADHG
jgi:heterodisulfide reductase subunit C